MNVFKERAEADQYLEEPVGHQLDFQVTIWSDDKDFLLVFEALLNNVENTNDALIALRKLTNLGTRKKIDRVEVQSVDINWSDED